MNVHMYITKSLCCTAETSTTLLMDYSLIKCKKKKKKKKQRKKKKRKRRSRCGSTKKKTTSTSEDAGLIPGPIQYSAG